jgi:hypothetical protein
MFHYGRLQPLVRFGRQMPQSYLCGYGQRMATIPCLHNRVMFHLVDIGVTQGRLPHTPGQGGSREVIMVCRFHLRNKLTGENVEGIVSSKVEDGDGELLLLVNDEVARWADFQIIGNPVVDHVNLRVAGGDQPAARTRAIGGL